MGDLFNDLGELDVEFAGSLTPAQLTLKVAELEVELETARTAYTNDHANKPALRSVMHRVAELRSWLRARAEASGERNPQARTIGMEN